MSEPPGREILSVEELLKTMNRKWSILAVVAIGNFSRVRFNELRRELSGISPKTLIETLRDLERIGVVRSEQFMEIPPKVEYYLTDDGIDFRNALLPVIRWISSRGNHGSSPVFTDALELSGE